MDFGSDVTRVRQFLLIGNKLLNTLHVLGILILKYRLNFNFLQIFIISLGHV
jgi:hypothetical protein